jgi:hypothetical protein
MPNSSSMLAPLDPTPDSYSYSEKYRIQMQSLNLAVNSPSKNYKVNLMVIEIVLQHQQLQKPWCIRLCISNHNKVWGYSVCWHGELQNSSTRDWDWNQSYDCLWNNLTLILTKHMTCSGKTWEEEKDTAKATMVFLVESNTGWISQTCAEELYTL